MTQYPSRMRKTPVIITTPVREPRDLFLALARVGYGRSDRPVPSNLDAMADLLKEAGVHKVLCAHWRLPASDDKRVRRVFEDLGVELQL